MTRADRQEAALEVWREHRAPKLHLRSNGDAERNRLRNRIERLPTWMRDIELTFWGLASIGGGT